MSPTADRLLIERPGLEPALLELVEGDITRVRAEIIVCAVTPGLAAATALDSQIHRAAGLQLDRELRSLPPCPVGGAVITGPAELASRGVRKIVHAVGPVWKGGTQGEPELLDAAYRKAFALAEQARARAIAFPAISAGTYGSPFPSVATIGLKTVSDCLAGSKSVERAVFVLYGASALRIFSQALRELRTT